MAPRGGLRCAVVAGLRPPSAAQVHSAARRGAVRYIHGVVPPPDEWPARDRVEGLAALERLASNATLRSYISRNARCFWKRHFGHIDDIMRRFVCGLSARQRKSNY